MDVVLKTAKSQLLMPWPRRVGSSRLSLPNVNAGGEEKQAVLNHWASLACAAPPGDLAQPATTFGREPPPKELVRFVFVVSPSGKPACQRGRSHLRRGSCPCRPEGQARGSRQDAAARPCR